MIRGVKYAVMIRGPINALSVEYKFSSCRILRGSLLPYLFILLIFVASGCQGDKRDLTETTDDIHLFHESVGVYTTVIVHDIFSPPVASRNYVYPLIAAYEVARLSDRSNYYTLAGQINGLTEITIEKEIEDICLPLAVTYAFLKTGKYFVFSESKIDEQIESVAEYYSDSGLSRQTIMASMELGGKVSDQIIDWASKDGYKESRSYAKFTIDNQPQTWKPTPPAYMEGIEPHWNLIRPFVIDSATQFAPPPPTPFDMTPGSPFYKELIEVYEAVKFADEEQFEIAHFWDCNPYKMNVTGHVMHATKKITPGGHWISIVGIACKSEGADILRSTAAYALTAIALADGFISCWDEKYRSILIRPETVINEYIDESWMPLLQTPPFPEYTSGHSVISSAAAVVLTHIFGDDFFFEDDTEVIYGLPVRSYNSFKQASDEAAISRLYGGIHYMPAIEHGVTQGLAIGQLVVDRIQIFNGSIN